MGDPAEDLVGVMMPHPPVEVLQTQRDLLRKRIDRALVAKAPAGNDGWDLAARIKAILRGEE